MRGFRVSLSPGAALMGALLFFLLREEELAALGLALLAHELGHLGAVLVLVLRPLSFRGSLCGFTLDYGGETGDAGHILIAAAGPLAGLGYAWAASHLGVRLDCSWLLLSAGLSLLLSLFNLLPVPPLDGGLILTRLAARALGEERGERLTGLLSLILSGALTALGLLLCLRGRGAALLLAGSALLFPRLRACFLGKGL